MAQNDDKRRASSTLRELTEGAITEATQRIDETTELVQRRIEELRRRVGLEPTSRRITHTDLKVVR